MSFKYLQVEINRLALICYYIVPKQIRKSVSLSLNRSLAQFCLSEKPGASTCLALAPENEANIISYYFFLSLA